MSQLAQQLKPHPLYLDFLRHRKKPRTDFQTRFWSKVDQSGTCWNWLGALDYKGYGKFQLRTKWNVVAHRVAFEISTGKEIPEGKVIDHLCRNRRCQNPEHMEIVEPKENTLRGCSDPANNARKTLCSEGHPISHIQPSGKRICSLCANRRSRKFRNENLERVREREREWWRKKNGWYD